MRSVRAAGSALLLQTTAALAAGAQPAPAPPIAVHQTSDRNVSRVIEQRSSVVSIDRSRTVTQGATTVTEVVRIGPDPAPIVVSQAGLVNSAVTFQQGSAPRLSLRQLGASNSSRTIQHEIP